MKAWIWSIFLLGCTTEEPTKTIETTDTCTEDDQVGDDLDSNCDGIDGVDSDQDGIASTSSGGMDCDDQNENIYPLADEICDSIDNNCDSLIDDDDPNINIETATTWYLDSDSDGYGGEETTQTCIIPNGYTDNSNDCDDQNVDIHPLADEVCDSIDNNCDSLIDDDDPNINTATTTMWFLDNDEDGYGTPNTSEQSCTSPAGYVADNQDCDDETSFAYYANASSEDIVGCYLDTDEDGYGDDDPQNTDIDVGSDCNDNDNTISPDAVDIASDGIDQDCDGYDALTPMSNFILPDTNPQSSTYGQTISVRDQLQKVSGWYFIKAT
jgi:hypothetical protein